MFDLEKSIAEWRREMLAARIEPGPLDELEGHLREEVAQNTDRGLNPAQAFALSVRELGQAHLLGMEFKLARNHEASRRLRRFHRFIGIIAVLYAVASTVYFINNNKFELRDRLLSLSAVAFGVGIVCSWRRICQWLPVVPARHVRVAIGMTLAILGNAAVAVFFNVGLPQLNFTEGELVVVVLWTMTLLVISGGIGHALDEAVRLKTADVT